MNILYAYSGYSVCTFWIFWIHILYTVGESHQGGSYSGLPRNRPTCAVDLGRNDGLPPGPGTGVLGGGGGAPAPGGRGPLVGPGGRGPLKSAIERGREPDAGRAAPGGGGGAAPPGEGGGGRGPPGPGGRGPLGPSAGPRGRGPLLAGAAPSGGGGAPLGALKNTLVEAVAACCAGPPRC